jgi:predicted CXXCH cytochrome family protein
VRRLTLLLAGSAVWLFLAAVPAFADGGPHQGNVNSGVNGLTGDSCAACHRAHTAQGALLLVSGGESVPNFCLSCHGAAGTGATTDVEDGVQYALTPTRVGVTGTVVGALRNGGFRTARIGSTTPTRTTYYNTSRSTWSQLGFVPALASGQDVTSSHMESLGLGNIEASTGTAWGNYAGGTFDNTFNLGPTVTVECTTCHNPHGNGQYRILIPKPFGSDSDADKAAVAAGFVVATTGAIGTVTDAPGNGAGANTRNYTIHQQNVGGVNSMLLLSSATSGTSVASGDYFHRYIPWNATSSAARMQDNPNGIPAKFNDQMNVWCSTCHTRIMASTGQPYQTDSGDAVFKYRHSNGGNKPCTTCHVAHGTNALMNGDGITTYSANFQIVPGTSGAAIATTVVKDSFLLKVDNRGTCQLCHDPTGTITSATTFGPSPVSVP